MKALCLSVLVALSVHALGEAPTPPDAARVHIRNVAEKTVLRPRNAEAAIGIPIVLYPVVDWKCVTWKMTPSAGGACTLTNWFTNKGIAADDKGAITQVAADKSASWKFVRLPGDRWRILSMDDKHCIAFEQNKVVLSEIKENDDSQVWELLPGPEKFSM